MKNVKMTSKAIRSICATAMALTLAMPTTIVAASESVLDSALATFDFEGGTESLTREGEKYLKLVDGKPVIVSGAYVMAESTALPEVIKDGERGNVLEFKDSVKVSKYEKTQEDAEAAAKAEGVAVVSDAALNQKYAVGELIQQSEKIGGRVKLDNPFKGMKFEGADAGVSISYWVKVPVIKVDDSGWKTTDGTGKDRGANSTTVVFNNSGRVVMNKDDYVKYLACKNYDESNPDYSLGDRKVVTDADGNAYVMHTNYGKLIRFNPNYPDQDMLKEASAAAAAAGGVVKKGGWFTSKDGGGSISVTDAEGNKYKISSFNMGGKIEDQNQYELFGYRYAEVDDKENGFSSKSKIREEAIDGSLQISTDNDFGFREDKYREETYTDANGEVKHKAVDGAKITNPNSDKFGTIQTLRHYNQFYFDGDEFATDVDEAAGEWHYVTIVIQNDWVSTYVDGVAADPEMDYQYMKETPGMAAKDHEFGKMCTGKMFNEGKGLRGVFGLGKDNVTEWSADGTAKESPANAVGMQMLDWLADEGTELYLGGTGFGSEALGQGYGTVEGVCLDDVTFFGTALTEDEAVELYEEVAAGNVQLGDIDGDGSVSLTDAQLCLKAALKIAPLDDDRAASAADVDKNGTIELADAQKILKVALKIEAGF